MYSNSKSSKQWHLILTSKQTKWLGLLYNVNTFCFLGRISLFVFPQWNFVLIELLTLYRAWWKISPLNNQDNKNTLTKMLFLSICNRTMVKELGKCLNTAVSIQWDDNNNLLLAVIRRRYNTDSSIQPASQQYGLGMLFVLVKKMDVWLLSHFDWFLII